MEVEVEVEVGLDKLIKVNIYIFYILLIMKLGFLFLCKNNINQLQLWLDFFKNNYDKCNIYIHSYDQQNITQDFVKKYHIDKVIDTGWGDLYDVIKYIMNISIKKNVALRNTVCTVHQFYVMYKCRFT